MPELLAQRLSTAAIGIYTQPPNEGPQAQLPNIMEQGNQETRSWTACKSAITRFGVRGCAYFFHVALTALSVLRCLTLAHSCE